MTCTQTQTLLDAYADHALPAWQTSRVRRHLTACPACAAELADILRLGAAVLAWHDVSAPAGLGDRLAALLPPFVSAPAPPRNRRVARRAAIGFGGVAAATGIGFWLLPGQPSQPTIAFADVERAMAQVQIVSWKSHSIVTDVNWHPLRKQKTAGSDSIFWIRCNPPASALISQPAGYKNLVDKRGTLQYLTHGTYVTYPPGDMNERNLEKSLKIEIKALTEKPVQKLSNQIGGHVRLINLPQQFVLLGGQKRVLFSYDQEVTVRAVVSHGRVLWPQEHYFTHGSTWVDPVTHLVTRIETQTWDDYVSRIHNQRRTVVESNFRYNQVPPPGVFDWSPPPGAEVQRR